MRATRLRFVKKYIMLIHIRMFDTRASVNPRARKKALSVCAARGVRRALAARQPRGSALTYLRAVQRSVHLSGRCICGRLLRHAAVTIYIYRYTRVLLLRWCNTSP